jgi:DNA-binding transcriptional regulator of glucitol operon
VSAVLLSRRWVALHVLAAVLVATCAVLTWWQFDRAAGGNARSIGYAFQWPCFAVFTVGVWAWLCRDAGRTAPRAVESVPGPGRVDDDLVLPPLRRSHVDPTPDDPALAEYNRMLARLAEKDEK